MSGGTDRQSFRVTTADQESWVDIDEQAGRCFISWFTLPDARGAGIATRLARQALASYPHRPVYAVIRPWNLASRRVAERLGFCLDAWDSENDTYALTGPARGRER